MTKLEEAQLEYYELLIAKEKRQRYNEIVEKQNMLKRLSPLQRAFLVKFGKVPREIKGRDEVEIEFNMYGPDSLKGREHRALHDLALEHSKRRTRKILARGHNRI